MKQVKNWLTSPVFEDELETEQAYFLHIIVWTLVCVPIPFLLYSFFQTPENFIYASTQVGFIEIINVITLIMFHRSHVKTAALFQIGMFWLFFTWIAYTGNGVHGEAYLLGYGLVIVIAGILLGKRGAVAFITLSLAMGLFMTIQEQRAALVPVVVSSPFTTWVVSLALFPVGALLQHLTNRRLRARLEQTRTSEAYFRNIIEYAEEIIYTLTPEGKFLFVSPAWTRMLGHSVDEVVGRHFTEFVHPDDIKMGARALRFLTRSGQAQKNLKYRVRHKNGNWFWHNSVVAPVKTGKGKNAYFVGIAQDITEQLEAENALRESEAIYRRAIEVAGAVPYRQTFDASGKIIYDFMGEGIRDITGYGPDEFSDELWGELTQERNLLEDLAPYSIDEAIDRVRSGETAIWKCEHLIKDRQGNLRWVFEAAVDLRDAKGIAYGSIGMYQDITEQKLAAQATTRRRDTLEKIVQIGKFITEMHDEKNTLQRIWHSVRMDLGFDRLGIYLYEPETYSVHGSYGTNNQGEMIEEWDSHIPLSDPATETISFIRAIEKVDGLYITRDYATEHNIPKDDIMDGVKDYAAVAAWAGERPMAVLCVDNALTKRPITDEDVEALSLFAGYAGLAIKNAQLNDKLQAELQQQKEAEAFEQRRHALLEKVLRLGKRVTETTDIPTILDRIWHGIHDDLDFDRLGIFLYNREGNSMDSTLGTDTQGNKVENYGISFGLDRQRPFKHLLETPNGLIFTHNYDIENNIPKENEMYGVKDFAAVAVWAGDKPVASISVDQLITQRRITVEQLEALRLFAGYAGLAIENARLYSALQTELDQRKEFITQLESKNAELERFTYTVSHDLKSPLVTITGFLGYLEKDALAGDAEKVSTNVKRIYNAAHKMQSLLNDLLELSRIGRIINPPEEISFNEIVNEAVDRVHGRLDEINAIIEIEAKMPVVYGDHVRLVEVIQNLIENAVKYANPQHHLRIGIGIQQTADSGDIFFVRDNGIGIAPEYHERIFGLFNKLDATAEGSGIGLSLVKRIIEVHGGHIWVESQNGKGATFYFTLPTKE